MEQEQVERIKFIKLETGKLVQAIEPINKEEWGAFEVLTSVHKALRKIDLSKISQGRLDIKPPERAEQIPLPDSAAVIPGEDSLNEPTNQTGDEELPDDSGAGSGAGIGAASEAAIEKIEQEQAAGALGTSRGKSYLTEAEIKEFCAGCLDSADRIPKDGQTKAKRGRPKKSLVGLGFNTGDDESQ